MGYSKYTLPPEAGQLELITAKAAMLAELLEEKKALDEKAKKLTDEIRVLQEKELPELMAEAGIAEFRTTDGHMVATKETIRVSLGSASTARAQAGYKWLDEHGYGGCIKRTVILPFNREQHEQAAQVAESLREYFPQVKVEERVEPITLTALIRNLIKEGEPVPRDTFGVFEQKVATID